MASNEEMSGETEGEEGEAAQSEDRGHNHPEDQGPDQDQDQDGGHVRDQGQEDLGQGSTQDADHDNEQRGIEDDVQQPDDGEDPADEMLVGLLPNMAEDQA